MEATMTKPKQSYVFDHKLTDEEIRALIDNYDYDPNWDDDIDDDNCDIEPLYDKYGNPTESMIRAFYETEHGLCEEVTLEELLAPYEND